MNTTITDSFIYTDDSNNEYHIDYEYKVDVIRADNGALEVDADELDIISVNGCFFEGGDLYHLIFDRAEEHMVDNAYDRVYDMVESFRECRLSWGGDNE